MEVKSVNKQTRSTKQRKTKNKGIIRANFVPTLVSTPTGIISAKILTSMKNTSQLSKEDSIKLSEAAQKGLKNSGLDRKGVEVFKIKENPILDKMYTKFRSILKNIISKKDGENSIEQLTELINEVFKYDESDSNAINAIIKELGSNKRTAMQKESLPINIDIKEQIAKLQALIFKEGSNACYLPKANKIITPDKSLQTSVFHEIGHALNNNGGIILKTLQKARPISTKVPGLILLISLFNKRKTTDKPQKNDSKIQKGADFVKRNAGILTAISFMPMVLEEGIASIRGQKLAKTLVKSKDLSKDIFKKIKITNLYGFTTYSLAAIAGYIGVKLAIKVKDTIQTNYENEQKSKFIKENIKPDLKTYQG